MKYYWCDFIVPVVMKMQKMKIPTILGVLLLAGTLSAGAQMNSDSLYKEPYRPHSSVSPDSLR